MHDVLLQCRFDMQNLKGKSVTILKLLIRAIYCRQAETHSSIRLDSTSKKVEMLILKKCEKIVWRYYASKWLDTLFQGMPLQWCVQELQKMLKTLVPKVWVRYMMYIMRGNHRWDFLPNCISARMSFSWPKMA